MKRHIWAEYRSPSGTPAKKPGACWPGSVPAVAPVPRRHEGRLEHDYSSGRYVLGGWELHCGDCFEVKHAGEWKATRIEHNSEGWYLLGVTGMIEGREARSHD